MQLLQTLEYLPVNTKNQVNESKLFPAVTKLAGPPSSNSRVLGDLPPAAASPKSMASPGAKDTPPAISPKSVASQKTQSELTPAASGSPKLGVEVSNGDLMGNDLEAAGESCGGDSGVGVVSEGSGGGGSGVGVVSEGSGGGSGVGVVSEGSGSGVGVVSEGSGGGSGVGVVSEGSGGVLGEGAGAMVKGEEEEEEGVGVAKELLERMIEEGVRKEMNGGTGGEGEKASSVEEEGEEDNMAAAARRSGPADREGQSSGFERASGMESSCSEAKGAEEQKSCGVASMNGVSATPNEVCNDSASNAMEEGHAPSIAAEAMETCHTPAASESREERNDNCRLNGASHEEATDSTTTDMDTTTPPVPPQDPVDTDHTPTEDTAAGSLESGGCGRDANGATVATDSQSKEAGHSSPPSSDAHSSDETGETSPPGAAAANSPPQEPQDEESRKEIAELQAQVQSLAQGLLKKWSGLKEVFRIPKRARVVRMEGGGIGNWRVCDFLCAVLGGASCLQVA